MNTKMDRIIDEFQNSFGNNKEKIIESFDKFYPRMCKTVDQFEKLLEMKTQSYNILDLACGTGPVAIELSKRGHNVTGVDCTPVAIEIANILSQKMNVQPNWLLGDMREINWPNNMDYVLLWDVIFGVLETDEEHYKVMSNISKTLKSGGRLLLEVYNRDFAKNYGVQDTFYYNENSDCFVAKEEHKGSIKLLKLYSKEELTKMFEKNNMKLIKSLKAWGYPNDPEGPPWRADYYIAEKK